VGGGGCSGALHCGGGRGVGTAAVGVALLVLGKRIRDGYDLE
jgi:hypothetical protein